MAITLDSRPVTRYGTCDNADCPANAQLVMSHGERELLFCGHHGRAHVLALVSLGWKPAAL